MKKFILAAALAALTFPAFGAERVGLVSDKDPVEVTLAASKKVALKPKEAGGKCLLRPGDKLTFVRTTESKAVIARKRFDSAVKFTTKPNLDVCGRGAIVEIEAARFDAWEKANAAFEATKAVKQGPAPKKN